MSTKQKNLNQAIKSGSFFQFCLNKNETNNKKQTDIGKIKNLGIGIKKSVDVSFT